jgi:hypothetical protein
MLWIHLIAGSRRVGGPGVAKWAEVGLFAVAQAQPGVVVGDLSVEPLEAGATFGRAREWDAGRHLIRLGGRDTALDERIDVVVLAMQVMVVELAEGSSQVESVGVELGLWRFFGLAADRFLELVSIAGDPPVLLGEHRQTTLNDVARLMNDRPRKTLGWNTPAEAMAEEIAAIKSTVALQT